MGAIVIFGGGGVFDFKAGKRHLDHKKYPDLKSQKHQFYSLNPLKQVRYQDFTFTLTLQKIASEPNLPKYSIAIGNLDLKVSILTPKSWYTPPLKPPPNPYKPVK